MAKSSSHGASKNRTKRFRDSFPFRPIRRRQRLDFCGALRYDPKRRASETVVQILCSCLQKTLNKGAVYADDVVKFFESQNVKGRDFVLLCEGGWLTGAEKGNKVHAILRLAGYAGTIDELWLSVYNVLRPSIPTKSGEIKPGRPAKSKNPWVHFVSSGQTRKPGSHRS